MAATNLNRTINSLSEKACFVVDFTKIFVSQI